MMPAVPKAARRIRYLRLPFLMWNFSGDLISIGIVMMQATTFLKKAFMNTGMSPARLIKSAITANEKADMRR